MISNGTALLRKAEAENSGTTAPTGFLLNRLVFVFTIIARSGAGFCVPAHRQADFANYLTFLTLEPNCCPMWFRITHHYLQEDSVMSNSNSLGATSHYFPSHVIGRPVWRSQRVMTILLLVLSTTAGTIYWWRFFART